jgi:hypothetical protein
MSILKNLYKKIFKNVQALVSKGSGPILDLVSDLDPEPDQEIIPD